MNLNQTLILGDLSGLQDYLFDVAAEGGGQARLLAKTLTGEIAEYIPLMTR